MHICVVALGYPTQKTIDFVFLDQLCRAFADQGIKITIIAPQSLTKSIIRNNPIVRTYSIIKVCNGNNIALYRPLYLSFGNKGFLERINVFNFNKAVRLTFKKIKVKPDVCYGHFWEAVYSIYSSAKKHNIPLIASSGEEEITLNRNYPVSDLKEFISYVSGVICVSTKNKNDVIAAGFAKDDKCEVIVNSVDKKLFYNKDKDLLRRLFGYKKNDFIVTFVGQFNERKGVKRLSDALTLLNNNSIKAMFIGSGNIDPDYDGIIFKGIVAHELLPDYLNCSDIFVLPTTNEGCSNAIIEAMACGLPIISSDLAFNYDILNKMNSIMINPYDISEIANAIKYLMENRDVIYCMSENAIKSSLCLTLDNRSKKIIEYMKKIID
jgi:teichuronic acid biosynthesis glycosyltransferase TuaC